MIPCQALCKPVKQTLIFALRVDSIRRTERGRERSSLSCHTCLVQQEEPQGRGRGVGLVRPLVLLWGDSIPKTTLLDMTQPPNPFQTNQTWPRFDPGYQSCSLETSHSLTLGTGLLKSS